MIDATRLFKLADEYRPTMDHEVLQDWAKDVLRAIGPKESFVDVPAVISELEAAEAGVSAEAAKFPTPGMEYSDYMQLEGEASGLRIAINRLKRK
ncbi:hypothetical protein [Mycobacteroides chelonae]|uniref:hypothetical protein n=1 Tax=Mycobacteroides chelonae TaxID=1774 RepID=UPI0010424EF8|nr:hypothetical protein [Mycobacteroides chelonae]